METDTKGISTMINVTALALTILLMEENTREIIIMVNNTAKE